MMYLQNTNFHNQHIISLQMSGQLNGHNFSFTNQDTNVSTSFKLVIKIHIGSSLSNLFQFTPGHAGQPKTKWVMRRVQATKPWPEWKVVSSATSANSNTQDLRNKQRNDSALYNLYMYCKIYLQIVLQIISNYTAHSKKFEATTHHFGNLLVLVALALLQPATIAILIQEAN